MELKNYIKNTALDIGFDMIHFTDCEAFTDLKEYLISRKEKGKDTSFEEDDIEKRIDPKKTLESCKSIIVLGMSYNSDFKVENPPNSGRLSKSSWGEDYHRVFMRKMNYIVDSLKNKVEFNYKCFVDTGPLVDRELARRSGLGYYGKNCSIINKEYGSFIFLGYILTDLELDVISKPLEDDCGDCDLCIRACPTGALEGAYTLNSKKCISYLTQTKDIIPKELREKMGDRIFGCDTCQLVCPKNKEIKLPNHPEFIPEITKGYIDIEELFSMSNREFKNKYGHMAGSWRGRNILKRNGVIALANMGDKKNLTLLIKEREKDNPNLNPYIDWAIEKLKSNLR